MLFAHVKKSHNETRTPPCFVKGLRRSEEGFFGVWGVVLGKECPVFPVPHLPMEDLSFWPQ